MKTYEDILALQNSGIACPCCNSTSGHFSRCPLLNRTSAENRSADRDDISHVDKQFLYALGVKW